MKGVTNSTVDPSDYTGDLFKALKEPDYLIALLQKYHFDRFAYNPDDDRFGKITPNDYREVINKQLHNIEDAVWKALGDAESDMREFLNLPPLMKE